MSDQDSGDIPPAAAAFAAATATLFGFTVSLLQFDAISRKILSPPRLAAKRRAAYKHRIESLLEAATLGLRRKCFALATGQREFGYSYEMERVNTDPVTSDEEMDALVKEILDKKNSSPVVVAIEQDENDKGGSNEYYLYLFFPPPSSEGSSAASNEEPPEKKQKRKSYRLIQTPLLPFCTKLAEAFDSQLTSTALCFITDASSGLGTSVLSQVLEKCNYGVAVVKEPIWMTTLAQMIQNRLFSPAAKAEKVLFALARLDGWRVRDKVGDGKTVVFGLPGQNCTPALLPLLQKVFPCERHVFAYDGCADSVIRGVALRRRRWGGFGGGEKKGLTGRDQLEAALSMPSYVTATTPLGNTLRSLRSLPDNLAKLPAEYADTIESWISSVDAFFQLKNDEKKTGYTPFVCRMGFLLGKTGLGHGEADVRDLALKNILQYATGSKSRPLPEGVYDAARESLKDATSDCTSLVQAYKISEADRVLIEECVFCHKSILIGDKTLLDTVQPSEEWSLKAARKLQSCMCCAPEEEDDEEEEDDIMKRNGDVEGMDVDASSKKTGSGGIDMSVPGAGFANMGMGGGGPKKKSSSSGGGGSKYVDGKAGFAFDPTAFGK